MWVYMEDDLVKKTEGSSHLDKVDEVDISAKLLQTLRVAEQRKVSRLHARLRGKQRLICIPGQGVRHGQLGTQIRW